MKNQYYYKENNGVAVSEVNLKLTLHRENGPAYLVCIENEIIIFYYQNGLLHREDGPAMIKSFTNGFIYFDAWYQKGKLHRKDGPAIEDYNGSGFKIKESYFLNGKIHREDGPAIINFNRPAEIYQYNEYWYLEGEEINKKSHDLSNPQMKPYYYYKEYQGEITSKNSPSLTLHREDGPAVIWMDDNQKTRGGLWYLEGKKIK